ENLVEYVKSGGGLLITSSSGGDYTNSTNLNVLTRNFGFEFLPNEINDSVNFVHLQKRPILTSFIAHVITEGINKLVFSSSCTTKILDFLEDGENIKIEGILRSGLNSWHRVFNGEEWVEEDLPKTDLLVAVDYYEGKVVAFGNISIFSSLAREYGFTAFDNDILIANILNWLIGSIESEGKPVTVELNLDLFYWIERIVTENKWENYSDLINISLKYFKDHYQEIMDEVEQKTLEKLERRKQYEEAERKEIVEKKEDQVFEKVPVQERKKEDLEDIMKSIEELTGEHYEISIDLDGPAEIKIANSSLSYTSEDVIEFENVSPKKAIWHGKATKTFVEWLLKKNTQ
ncbi:MAG: hypothetical protein ACW986_14945, partial [Promethearchaeota archaeon]